jgi:hypothetical protein
LVNVYLLQARTPATAGLVVFVNTYLLQARALATAGEREDACNARRVFQKTLNELPNSF